MVLESTTYFPLIFLIIGIAIVNQNPPFSKARIWAEALRDQELHLGLEVMSLATYYSSIPRGKFYRIRRVSASRSCEIPTVCYEYGKRGKFS